MIFCFGGLLEQYGSRIVPNRWERHGLREVDRRTYFGLFLFGLFNPVVDSMRALCSATRLERTQAALGRQGPVHLSGFSDAQHVFDPEILEPVGCGFVLRLNNTATYEVVTRHELTAQAKAEGVMLDAMVRLGHRGGGGLQRVLVLERAGMKEPVVLVTSEPPDSLSALEVLALYRHRWQVEIFFRWLKCLVPCRHWFAESPEGVRILIYLCLIKALLLADLTGGKPNKRMMELLRWHQLGWAGEEELARLLATEEAARQRRAAAKVKA